MATDKPGIEASVDYLISEGYSNVEVIHHPVDLKGEKDGLVYWFEVKYSESKNGKMFGAATLTEWEFALSNPKKFYFLIAHKSGGVDYESKWKFIFIDPSEFTRFSTIPPYKIFFNFDTNDPSKVAKRRSAIPATETNLKFLIQSYNEMKERINIGD